MEDINKWRNQGDTDNDNGGKECSIWTQGKESQQERKNKESTCGAENVKQQSDPDQIRKDNKKVNTNQFNSFKHVAPYRLVTKIPEDTSL